jgi:predicted pyridoxine 5'-phosphate oxidase superfamily flavin-nucleotide-binding protein
MADPSEIAAAYRAALAPDPGDAKAVFEPLLSPGVRLVGPFGAATGREAVTSALGGPMLPGLLAAASWDDPVVDGETLTLRAAVAPGLPVGGVLSTITISDGLVTEIIQEYIAAARPDPTPLQLTAAMRQAVNEALADSLPMMLAYVDTRGVPHLSLRGSVQVHGDRELAIWVRDPEGGFLKALETQPMVALWYRNPTNRTNYQFAGRARVVSDVAATRAVYDATPERERNLDPRAHGRAVVVELDRIEGAGPEGRVLMDRTA